MFHVKHFGTIRVDSAFARRENPCDIKHRRRG